MFAHSTFPNPYYIIMAFYLNLIDVFFITMKTNIFLIIATLFTSLQLMAQRQRLCILPQTSSTITRTTPAQLKTLGVDYYLEAPSKANMAGQAPYNLIYNDNQVVVKINGLVSTRSFKSLFDANNPLLLITPTSSERVSLVMNPKNAEAKSIKSIQVAFKKQVIIGNDPKDSNIVVPQAIFDTWGFALPHDEFNRKSKTLSILEKNKKLNVTTPYQLTPESKQLCDIVENNFDFSMFTDADFKNLVDNDFIVIDNQGNMTAESIEKSLQLLYYQKGLNDAKHINQYASKTSTQTATTVKNSNTNSSNNINYSYVNTSFKQAFYPEAYKLTSVRESNKSIRDTNIAGQRYVLMLAWKSPSFTKFFKTDSLTNTRYFVSNETFFKYPLFMTVQQEMVQLNATHSLYAQPEADCKMRLRQTLGLPPNSGNDVFVEFWVKENDLFRPAIDSSLNSNRILYQLSDTYIQPFAEFSSSSYTSSNVLYQYPFTGMGYTYDYNPASTTHVGLSEFVLRENRTVYVRSITNTMDYLKQNKR